ncbi:MAG: hypothetical protein AAF333_07760 [Planctomycetota bacterium]
MPHPVLSALSPTLSHDVSQAPADTIVAQALACLPPFQSWAHKATPTAIENVLLDLNEQELMTTAAVCLIRLVRLQQQNANAA